MKGQRWKTMAVEGRRGGEDGVRMKGFERLFIGSVGQKTVGRS